MGIIQNEHNYTKHDFPGNVNDIYLWSKWQYNYYILMLILQLKLSYTIVQWVHTLQFMGVATLGVGIRYGCWRWGHITLMVWVLAAVSVYAGIQCCSAMSGKIKTWNYAVDSAQPFGMYNASESVMYEYGFFLTFLHSIFTPGKGKFFLSPNIFCAIRREYENTAEQTTCSLFHNSTVFLNWNLIMENIPFSEKNKFSLIVQGKTKENVSAAAYRFNQTLTFSIWDHHMNERKIWKKQENGTKLFIQWIELKIMGNE